MKGVNHIITGISTAVIVDTSIRAVSYELESSFYNDIFSLLSWQFAIDSQTAFGYTAWIVLAYMVNIVMFIFGCLLPDCDQKNSSCRASNVDAYDLARYAFCLYRRWGAMFFMAGIRIHAAFVL